MPAAMQATERAEEAELIERALRREAVAIRTITRRYNRRLYRIARSILRDDSEAEDAVQAAYLKGFAALPQFRRGSGLGTWLTRIVMNEALGRVRRRRPTLPFDEALAATGGTVVPFPIASTDADPERAMAQRQIHVLLERAIDELAEPFRTVLVARVLEEMSVEETADLLGIKPETVKTRLHRARGLLRQSIERRIGPLLINAFPFDGRRCERMTEEVVRRMTEDA